MSCQLPGASKRLRAPTEGKRAPMAARVSWKALVSVGLGVVIS